MLGFLGGGQLARMMALEARRMGYKTIVLTPEKDDPAVPCCDAWIGGGVDDLAAARALAERADAVTIDTEHVPAEVLATLETITRVRPSASVLRTVQDRWVQRTFLSTHAMSQTVTRAITEVSDLDSAAAQTGFPCILKKRRAGYDGRGQTRVEHATDLRTAWEAFERAPCVLEAVVPFVKEVSILVARGDDGEMRTYPVVENVHKRHILFTSRVPADLSPKVAEHADRLGRTIAEALGLVGMLAVELFVLKDETLLVNELAPRTHNSGHFTWGACATSQFEQQIRAMCGLPLGDTTLTSPCVMVNLLGEDLGSAEKFAFHPHARLHLYGKRDAALGRKMGHVLFLGAEVEPFLTLADTLLNKSPA